MINKESEKKLQGSQLSKEEKKKVLRDIKILFIIFLIVAIIMAISMGIEILK